MLERNKKITVAVLEGLTFKDVATMHGISSTRVGQIVRRTLALTGGDGPWQSEVGFEAGQLKTEGGSVAYDAGGQGISVLRHHKKVLVPRVRDLEG